MTFADLGVAPHLIKVLEEQNYSQPYPIQEAAIPHIIKRKDLLGIAKTGSGKTAAYVLPILMNVKPKRAVESRHIRVLVLVPTRELAVQVRDVFQLFSKGLPDRIKTIAVYGGASINPQMIAMQGVDILVATPGRLIELVESNAVHLSTLRTLVLDEADKMLNLGFKDEMDRIFNLLPNRRQNLLFSATLSDKVSNIQQILMTDPIIAKMEGSDEDNIEWINQQAFLVTDERKGPLLRYLIKKHDLKQVLVFTSSVYKADLVAEKLRKNGIDALSTHSKKSPKARRDALREFKSGELRVLVATDLLSRGIDIEFLPHVINYELPRSPKDYIHRIGRTGRAESPGDAISLVTVKDKNHFIVIQKKMGKKIYLEDSKDIDLKGY